MMLFFTFVFYFITLSIGGLLDEVPASNICTAGAANAFYFHFIYTHLYERGTILIYFIFFLILLIIIGGLAKVKEGNMNCIGAMAVFSCILTFIAFIMTCIGSPHYGIFY